MFGSEFWVLNAGERRGGDLAGDQLYVDFDISAASVPPGLRATGLRTPNIEHSTEPEHEPRTEHPEV